MYRLSKYWEFPSDPLVKKTACQCKGFDPWSGNIPHASGQISPCSATAEQAL